MCFVHLAASAEVSAAAGPRIVMYIMQANIKPFVMTRCAGEIWRDGSRFLLHGNTRPNAVTVRSVCGA